MIDVHFAIGTMAAVLTTGAFFAQVVKTHRTKHTKDLSVLMFVMTGSGTALWCLYGILLGETPIIIANAIALALNVYILYMKVIHG